MFLCLSDRDTPTSTVPHGTTPSPVILHHSFTYSISAVPGAGLCRENTVKHTTGSDLKEPGQAEEARKKGSLRVAHYPLPFFGVGIIYKTDKWEPRPS